MKLWSQYPLYHEFLRKHDHVFQLFKIEDYPKLYEETESIIRTLESLNECFLISKKDRQLLAANILFLHARSLEKIHPPCIDSVRKIVSFYEQALSLLDTDRSNTTFFSCCLGIAEICIHYVDQKYPELTAWAIKYAGLVRDSIPADNKYQYALATTKIGDAYASTPPGKENVEQAIRFYLEALESFKQQNVQSDVARTTGILAHTYLNFTLRDNPINIEHAIFYASEYLTSEQAKVFSTDRGRVYADIAHAYSIRRAGPKDLNCFMAEGLFQSALEDLDEDGKLNDVWVVTALRYLYFHSQHRKISEDLRPILEKIFSRIRKDTHPDIWLHSLKIRNEIDQLNKINLKARKDTYSDELMQLSSCISKNTDPGLWISIQLAIADELDLQDPQIIPSIIGRYKKILQEAALLQLSGVSELRGDINTRIARCYCRLGIMSEADLHFSSAIEGLAEDSNEDSVFYNMHKSLRDAPIVAIHCKDVSRGLKYADYLHCKTVALDLERLAIIDTQVNRHSILRRYTRLKMAQRVLHCGIQYDSLEQMKWDAKELDAVLTAPSCVGTRAEFYDNLDNYLSKLDSWVLVPILGERNSRLILIPPRANVHDIYVSEELNINFSSENNRFFHDSESGWLATTLRIQSLPSWIKEENFRRFKKERARIDASFEEMETHLWSTYCEWVVNILQKHSTGRPVSLCIITTGPLISLPFAMARNPETGEQLIDIAEISYAPSLYSFYSLCERVKRYLAEPSLGFIKGTDDPDLPYLDMEYSLVAQTFQNERRERLDSRETELFEKAINTFGSLSHWHVSTHAAFAWFRAGFTSMNFGAKPLTPDLLIALAPEKYLRLGVINACESAIHEHIDSDSDPEGFLYHLLKIGAIGAIGNLWGLTDASGAILMGRFYYYYRIEHLTPAAALRCAQCWIRDATVSELSEYIQAQLQDGEENYGGAFLANLEEHLPHEQPFSHPLYWAGYVLLGQ